MHGYFVKEIIIGRVSALRATPPGTVSILGFLSLNKELEGTL